MGVNGDFIFVHFFLGMGGMEACLSVDKNKPIERDSERNNSVVHSLEREEGMGSWRRGGDYPWRRRGPPSFILAGVKVKGIGGDAAGLVLLMAESRSDKVATGASSISEMLWSVLFQSTA